MKLDKTNVCVLIESEAHLQQAREVLERYGEVIDFETWHYGNSKPWNYLNYADKLKNWGIGCERQYKITLTELEEILKEEV